MKNFSISENHKLLISSLIFSAVVGSGANALAVEQVGVSAAVRGNVELIQQGQTPRKASSGLPVYFEEKILSGTDSGMQLMLLDKTTFTVGPDSEIVIDEMVYDPTGGNSSLAVSVAQGAFRYLSGEIGKKNPQNVTINTPSGQIGIRGTNLFATQTNGNWYFGLLGPGPDNNTGDKPGGFVFKNELGEAQVTRPGYGFAVDVGGAPGSVGPIPPEVFAKFSEAVAKQGEAKKEGEEDNGKDSGTTGSGATEGASLASTEDASGQTAAIAQIAAVTQQVSQTVQSGLAELTAASSATSVASTSFEILTFDAVRGYSGSATYIQNSVKMFKDPNVFYSNCNCTITSAELQSAFSKLAYDSVNLTPVGTYDFSATANFTARTVTGAYTNINVSGAALSGTSIVGKTLGFDGTTSTAGVFNYNSSTGTFDPIINTLASGVAGYNLDGGFTFLKSTGANPIMAQGLAITDTNGKDVVVGASIVRPQ